MTLVIRDRNLHLQEGDKLYKDVMVTEGTILALDFSNTGTTDGFNVDNGAIVRNLAKETAEQLEAVITGSIKTSTEENQLNSKKGFTGEALPASPSGEWGVNIQGVLDYLTENSGHSFAIIMWAENGTIGTARSFMRSKVEEDYTNTSLRANISATGNITVTVAGAQVAGSGQFPPATGVFATAYEYRGVGQPVQTWINTTDKGDTPMLASGFNAAGGTLIIGRPEIAVVSDAAIYRILIEDLTVSGRTTEEIMLKDWNYVNALGEFLGIQKRPFAIR